MKKALTKRKSVVRTTTAVVLKAPNAGLTRKAKGLKAMPSISKMEGREPAGLRSPTNIRTTITTVRTVSNTA